MHPRRGILQGTFNPEVFTAALGPVMQFYRSGSGAIDSIYTDAEAFFREATYPTEGMRQTLSSVFRRIAGDQTAPSIYRLETAFGGGGVCGDVPAQLRRVPGGGRQRPPPRPDDGDLPVPSDLD